MLIVISLVSFMHYGEEMHSLHFQMYLFLGLIVLVPLLQE